ncbi:galactan beta-1,4-galactosyltransferase GALS1-like isoform X1 [Selaginella moellendorffii]|uniref:galactan beta-1,4-galactosyltransferase GALS1-like isoform X1 n=2 Tax=Selaginella moellendorffii TaxID=88036 RepID=UPI000D1C2B8E|nr:galactan beta-1,4-galactosyltransferase GALS1-like isoform X1 [Selaginella moellendorffii]|eukprot:XP_024525344.1 galactan beta-1,4-galactosyltransferase GALS1-like isoform X1 [Selaginella moellendorffii]
MPHSRIGSIDPAFQMKAPVAAPGLLLLHASASGKSTANVLLVGTIFLVASLLVILGSFTTKSSGSSSSSVEFVMPVTQSCEKSSPSSSMSKNFVPAEAIDPIPALEEQGTGIHSNVRHLHPIGVAAHTFVLTGGYRTEKRSFAVVGLASKPLHVFGKPEFSCEWVPTTSASQPTSDSPSSSSIFGRAKRILPDWGYGRVYTVVVVHCYFKSSVGENGSGGRLILHAGEKGSATPASKITALVEAPGSYSPSQFLPKYDYLYCGSSLFGDINPQRLREWIAYHAWLFGPRSHFVLHDVGGARSKGVRSVLEPWIRSGRVTVQDFREQARFDGYYYNQFLVVNDCLFRYKHAANWTFFFDVDEYVNVPGPSTLDSVLDELGQNYSQIMFEQNLMGHNVCVNSNRTDRSRQWGFEKLVFINVQKSVRLDRKYVLRAPLADSAGVHLSENVRGKSLYSRGQISYFHFHNTITEHQENCREFVKVPKNRTSKVWLNKIPYLYDDKLSTLADEVKQFELQTIGPVTL